jgi:hypothetical protein
MRPEKQWGITHTKTLGALLIAIFIVIASRFFYVEYKRNYWDDRIKEFCKKDGGVKVIEETFVSLSEYQSLKGSSGEISIRLEQSSNPNFRFFLNLKETSLHKGNPEVLKVEQRLVRRRDEKVIAVLTSYSRVGGDAVFADNPSSFSCPANSGNWFESAIKSKGE